MKATCDYCRKLVRVDKPIFGSLHICVTDEERVAIDRARWLMRQQVNYCARQQAASRQPATPTPATPPIEP